MLVRANCMADRETVGYWAMCNERIYHCLWSPLLRCGGCGGVQCMPILPDCIIWVWTSWYYRGRSE
jgi:hypothetical protein